LAKSSKWRHDRDHPLQERAMTEFAEIEIRSIEGETRKMADFAGKVLLVVNVASKCGFTPQYAGLEALQKRFAARGFDVLGFPCDQFGHQEPGNEAEIEAFCTLNYGVSFPMFAKIEVNGAGAHPLYRHLKTAAPGLLGTEAIKWNFTKFLIGRDGKVLKRYAPNDKPEDIAGDVERAL
jgi:glutathione peroxidase